MDVRIILSFSPTFIIHFAFDIHALPIRIVSHFAQVKDIIPLAALQEEIEIPVFITETAIQTIGKIRERRSRDIPVFRIEYRQYE